MRQLIRQHPWRLEILPLLMVVLSISESIASRMQTATSQVTEVADKEFAQWFVPVALAWGWLDQFQRNHQWVLFGYSDSAFRRSVVSNSLILSAVGLWQTSKLFTVSSSEWLYVAWAVLFITAWPVQMSLACTCKPTAKTEAANAEEVPSVDPHERFYYREVQTRWASLLSSIGLGGCMMGLWLSSHTTLKLVGAIIVLVFALSTVRASFVVTKGRISARIGLSGISIPLAKVRSCGIVQVTPLGNFEGHSRSFRYLDGARLYAAPSYLGTGLRVMTNDLYIFVFGMNRSETAYALVNAALASQDAAPDTPRAAS